MPLEDDLCDIIKKARMGLGMSVEGVAQCSGVSEPEIAILERGERPKDRAQVRALASALGLRPDALERIAIDQWQPAVQEPAPFLDIIHGSVGGYGVQGYLLHDGAEALVIDTGYNATSMIAALTRNRFRLLGICLTHGHSDHADGIEALLAHREVPVYLGEGDRELLGWSPPARLLAAPVDGFTIPVGRLRLRCLTTPGHTPGGICYLLEGGDPCCFVGDTLFAGSIGRSNPSGLYRSHLASVHRGLLTLPSECRLLPGHGPATTVAEERAHNPFAITP